MVVDVDFQNEVKVDSVEGTGRDYKLIRAYSLVSKELKGMKWGQNTT